MHKLVVNGLYLFSIKEKKAKYVSFADGINVITSSKDNGTKRGKSVIMKSIYHTLGADCIFEDKWNINDKVSILDFSDVLIIIIVILALLCVGMYYLNKKGMKKMIQAQDFIDQNRTTVQNFVIDKRQEKTSKSNMNKDDYEQKHKTFFFCFSKQD